MAVRLADQFAWIDRQLEVLDDERSDEISVHRERRVRGERGPVPDPVERTARTYQLSRFDVDALLLAAAPSFDRRLARRLIALDGDPRPSVGLAVDALLDRDSPDRFRAIARFAEDEPLVRNALVELHGDGPVMTRRLAVPDAVIYRLVGLDSEGPCPVMRGAAADDLALGDTELRAVADAATWLRRRRGVVAVVGREGSGRTALALAIAAADGRPCIEIGDHAESIVRRESRWHDAIPLAKSITAPLARLARECGGAIVILDGERASTLRSGLCEVLAVHCAMPDAPKRVALWRRSLRDQATTVDLTGLAHAWPIGPGRIEQLAASALDRLAPGQQLTDADLNTVCRASVPADVGELGELLTCDVGLDELVIDSATRRELDLAIAWTRQRTELRHRAAEVPQLRGASGLVCLFAGPSGTGKTMAARVLGKATGLDVVRVDLSRVVDKYIGETEKQLSRLFVAAEAANFILFFDEADALFARRVEVRDAHDRFANLETSYLLQRIERHPGVVVLASNLRSNLDDAFRRRIQVIAEFPMPDLSARAMLWHRMLPAEAVEVDVELLAKHLPLAGGDIRNAVLTSIVLAAEEGTPLEMRHVVVATWRELQRNGRLPDTSVLAPWREYLQGWLRPRAE